MATDLDEADVIELLARDVSTTLGVDYRAEIRQEARNLRFLEDREGYFYMVVQHVQAGIHDGRIDNTWPACPNHHNHPMWFENGMWRADGQPAAKLGELGDWLRGTETCLP